jgi:hypothetical protein
LLAGGSIGQEVAITPVDAQVERGSLGPPSTWCSPPYRRSASAGVSLVDHASFVLMRALGIGRAFAYDDDFEREGFELVA